MPKLIMCKGLPGSGKSTWASSYQGTHRKTLIVCKDDIRRSLEATGWTWSHENEREVIKERDKLIANGLKMGWTVISSDTNLAPKHKQQLNDLARKFNADWEIKDFTDVDPNVCIERDSMREGKARVGPTVIWNMWNQYLRPKDENMQIEKVEVEHGLRYVVICDLDGTAAIHNGRGPFEYEKCDTDLPNEPIRDILWAMHQAKGDEIIYLSGREDTVYHKTSQWLLDHRFPGGNLYMRKAKDHRKDYVVKLELFNAHVRGMFNVRFCLDDRDQVVKLWRDLGLTCLQVGYGNF